MSYRGYTESMEVLIDILDELRAIKEALTPKEINKEVKPNVQTVSSPKRPNKNTVSRKRNIQK